MSGKPWLIWDSNLVPPEYNADSYQYVTLLCNTITGPADRQQYSTQRQFKSWSIRRLINHIKLTQVKKRLQSTTLSTQLVEFSCQCIEFSYRTLLWVCDRNEKLLAFTPFCRKIGKRQNGIRPYQFLIELRGEISKGYLIKCASLLLVNRDVAYSKANK